MSKHLCNVNNICVLTTAEPKINPIVYCWLEKAVFCYVVLSDLYSFAIILLRKRELSALLEFSSCGM